MVKGLFTACFSEMIRIERAPSSFERAPSSFERAPSSFEREKLH